MNMLKNIISNQSNSSSNTNEEEDGKNKVSNKLTFKNNITRKITTEEPRAVPFILFDKDNKSKPKFENYFYFIATFNYISCYLYVTYMLLVIPLFIF